jgi:uncharacterized protein Yka (UPF0111/DUF47 family)
MGLNSFFKIFLPKDKIFFTLFEEMAETVYTMATLLQQLVNEPDADKRASISSQIEALEHKNDDATHRVFTELGINFITPLDREDIHYLATALDDVADHIYSSSKKLVFYKVNPNDTGIQKFSELIVQSTAELKKDSIENQADDVFDMSIDALYNMESDFKAVIKKREIYQVLELATDKCEDVANVIESIIIKYA